MSSDLDTTDAFEAISTNASYSLVKNVAVRAATEGAQQWELSGGEGSVRCFYGIPSEVAAFLLTCEPQNSFGRWIDGFSRAGLTDADSRQFVEQLVKDGILNSLTTNSLSAGEEQWVDLDWSDALHQHWAERDSKWIHDYTNNPKVMTRYDGENVVPDTQPPASFDCVPMPGAKSVRLADPLDLGARFRDVQQQRRTSYQFENTSISFDQVSTLLQWTLRARWSDGVTPLRVSQSYSRGEPFVGFVAFGENPPDGFDKFSIYQYDPGSNTLVQRQTKVPQKWSDLMWGQQFADAAPMALILAVNWPHFMWKYRFARAYRWVYTECGAFMQTALTVGTALGLHAWQSPALDDERAASLLGYDESLLSPVYFAAFGGPQSR